MNLYGYAAGDPINNRDPFGLSSDTLTAEQTEVLGDMCDQVDCSKVNIVTPESATGPVQDAIMRVVQFTGRPVTLGNSIYLTGALDLSSADDVGLLAHEMTHVFQYQTLQRKLGPGVGAVGYYELGIFEQALTSAKIINPYAGGWGLLEPLASVVGNCFSGAGSCARSPFTPPGGNP